MESKKLFLLDAYALIYRAYYALMQSPRFSSKGFNTSAIYGFVNTLQDVLKKENPSHIAVCFDPAGPTFRHEAYEKYKAEREETPEDIRKSIPYIKQIIKAYRIPIIEVPRYEADDVIGTLSKLAQEHGFTTYMMTPDKDFGQLVTDKVKIYKPGFKGGEYEIRGVEEVCAKYELKTPLQVIDILALMGDKVDNIPGCPGVGNVTAIKLVKEFGSVENLLANTDKLKGALKVKVESNAEQITFSKFLATIKLDVPIEFNEKDLIREDIDADALGKIFEELEFRSLITRIITKREGQVAVITEATPKKVITQPSLFDVVEEEVTAVEPAGEYVSSKGCISSVNHKYRVIFSQHDVKILVAKILTLEKCGFYLTSTGSDAMTAVWRGIAFCTGNHESTYVELPADKDKRIDCVEILKKVFESNKLVKIGTDVKRDYIILHNEGINISEPYYDTTVAHYLLQPEISHDFQRLAETELSYCSIPLETVLGTKGKGQKSIIEAPIEAVTDYSCEAADIALQLYTVLNKAIEQNEMMMLLNDIELPLISVLADMEICGIRVDVDALYEYSKALTIQMKKMELECYELAGEEFNTASPMKVGEILFDKLKIDDKAKRTKSGQYSTTEDILTKLRDKHPLVDKILELRGIKKLLTTYVNALPALINPSTGRIHTTYNQTVTATGRLSSTNPNMQNIPVRNEEGREIRRAFIPADGNIFFSADYSQIELRLVADLSNDTTMVEAFKAGEDIHQLTAAKIYHESIEDVTQDQRRKAKTANFGILYGISAFGLSERLNIPRSEAKMLIDGYLSTYPQVHDYMNKSIERAKEQGYVTTLFGRRRMLPEINSHNSVVRSFSERNAINAPIQGTAADIIKLAMVRIAKRFDKEGINSKMIMQVHDELNFDVIPKELERVTEIVTTEMQGAYKGNVSLTASYNSGHNWLEAH
ncbi:MAG: DNA polymerase I [Muribaculaceae bacterium]